MAKITKSTIVAMARDLKTDEDTVRVVLTSLNREGVKGATHRFPMLRNHMLRYASVFQERGLMDMPDVEGLSFVSNTIAWTVHDPVAVDHFKAVVHDRDSFRSHFRVQMHVADVASGVGEGAHLRGRAVDLAERDPALRVNVCRQMRAMVRGKLSKFISGHTSLTPFLRRFAVAIAESLSQTDRMYLHTTLRARELPHMCGPEYHHLSVDAVFTVTFELNMDRRGENGVIINPEVITDGNMFEISGKTKVQAISPIGRRSHRNKAVEEGPDEPMHTEVTIHNGDEESTMEIHPPANSLESVKAGIVEDIEKATAWWRSNKGLIQPSLSEIAGEAISAMGEEASKDTIDTLVDLSLPTLHSIVQKRSPQLEIGMDAAVVGLATLLRSEFNTRLR